MNNYRLLPSQLDYIHLLKSKRDNFSRIQDLKQLNEVLLNELNDREERIWEMNEALYKIEQIVRYAR